MSKEKRIKNLYSIFRTIIQLGFFFLFYMLAFNYITPYIKTSIIPITVPVLISLRSNLSSMAGSLTFIQYMLSLPLFPWIPLASILIIGVIIGRLLCGWACPFGFIQDLLSRLSKEKIRISQQNHNKYIKIKFVFLGITLFVSFILALSLHLDANNELKRALGPFAEGIFYTISPNETFFGDLPGLLAQASTGSLNLNISNYLLYFNLIFLIFTLIGAFKIPRFWCKYLCPLGGFLGIIAKCSLLGIRRDLTKCDRCMKCVKVCPMQIKILELPWEKFTDTECTLCVECIEECPNDALKLKI
ncbi:MAG: 4Fe-4S binding protein [Candidatus Bathyarchaeota archaeon]|nr:4Fe-4S binding protein [Candidatus Bathyarchaeota archaeon]MCZ2845905.1 4Fe-4S binding protein [Candidatus Bathyarchaeota archaeon]